MSANNWTACQVCKRNAACRYQAAIEMYGIVSQKVYENAIAAAASASDRSETLAEYYDIGVNADDFSMNYRCVCHRCGLKREFKMKEKMSG